MKNKPSKSKTLSFLSRIIRVREWADWSRIRAGGLSIGESARDLFVLKTSDSIESFDDAQRRMNLSDDDLEVRARALLLWSILLIGLAISLFAYAIFLFIMGSFHAGLLAVVLMVLSISLSFRYNFWYTQIKMRKLGCTFQDWFQYLVRGKTS